MARRHDLRRQERTGPAPAAVERPAAREGQQGQLGNRTLAEALEGGGGGFGAVLEVDALLQSVGIDAPLVGGSNHELQASLVAAAPEGAGVFARVLRHRLGADAPPAVTARLAGLLRGGEALPPAQLARFSAAFGHDFSAVRVHTDAAAAQVAAELSAHAFAVGEHLFFGAGEWAPGSPDGDRLLAHELTHVLQHDEGRLGGRRGVSDPADSSEREAYRNEDRVLGVLGRMEPAGEPAAAGGAEVAAEPVVAGEAGPAAEAEPGLRGAEAAPELTAAPLASAAVQRDAATEQPSASQLIGDLVTLLQDLTWAKIRARLYPQISAPAVQRARRRLEGSAADDLGGLGRVDRQRHFAAAIRAIQGRWAELGPEERGDALLDAINAELHEIRVPVLSDWEPLDTGSRGQLDPGTWTFRLSRGMLDRARLSESEAADLCNTTLHEARHAEQIYLGARWSAGHGADPAQVEAEMLVPAEVAREAARHPISDADSGPDRDLAELSYRDAVTNRASVNQRWQAAHDTVEELGRRRAAAQAALDALRRDPGAANIQLAVEARDRLRRQALAVEQAYRAYRAIPVESDAHDVGDAAEVAYRAARPADQGGSDGGR